MQLTVVVSPRSRGLAILTMLTQLPEELFLNKYIAGLERLSAKVGDTHTSFTSTYQES